MDILSHGAKTDNVDPTLKSPGRDDTINDIMMCK